MQAVSHSPQFAAEVNIPQSVGREFAMPDMSSMDQKKMKVRKIADALKRKR